MCYPCWPYLPDYCNLQSTHWGTVKCRRYSSHLVAQYKADFKSSMNRQWIRWAIWCDIHSSFIILVMVHSLHQMLHPDMESIVTSPVEVRSIHVQLSQYFCLPPYMYFGIPPDQTTDNVEMDVQSWSGSLYCCLTVCVVRHVCGVLLNYETWTFDVMQIVDKWPDNSNRKFRGSSLPYISTFIMHKCYEKKNAINLLSIVDVDVCGNHTLHSQW